MTSEALRRRLAARAVIHRITTSSGVRCQWSFAGACKGGLATWVARADGIAAADLIDHESLICDECLQMILTRRAELEVETLICVPESMLGSFESVN